jgi:cathepsin L
MKTLACVALALVGVFASQSNEQPVWKKEFTLDEFNQMNTIFVFKQWSKDFGRNYETIDEETLRYKIWYENLGRIATTNTQQLPYKLRLNQFADLTDDEFRFKVHGHQGSCYRDDLKSKIPKISTRLRDNSDKLIDTPPAPLPTSVNWVTKGVVTPVKNQGDCGSCWAFSTTGSIECNYAIAKGVLNSLSEQQLVDCSDSYGNEGCDGGLMDYAFKYVIANGGLSSETEYPYTGVDGTCKSSTCGTKYDAIGSYKDVTADQETALETAAASGCVSVAIEADQYAFQYYSSGILTGLCGTALDHGVLVVGYGVSGSQDYWLVKNSWGTTWGEQGYVQICRACNKNGSEGECGINMEPSYPVV